MATGTILAIIDLQVIPMLPDQFWINWPSSSEEEAKKMILVAKLMAIFDFR